MLMWLSGVLANRMSSTALIDNHHLYTIIEGSWKLTLYVFMILTLLMYTGLSSMKQLHKESKKASCVIQ